MWRTLKSMRAIVANAPSYAQTSPVLTSIDLRDKVKIIPLGIDENTYPRHGDDSVLDRLGISGGEPFVLFIGVLRYYKGLHTLIEAAPQVGAKIVVAGSGPEYLALKEQADCLQARNVIFAGQVTDAEKVSLLKHCRALVLPSHLRSEAYGMVLVEASMYGKPMVSCEIGTGTSFVNIDGETGIVVPPENPTELASAVSMLLTDDELSKRYSKAARLRYEQYFSGEAVGRGYSKLLKEVASR
jgi:rhamnosyl/mannosyltransferase